MLLAQSISKTYPTPAGDLHVLRDVSLELDRGQSLAILGPSGSGKSTLLNILGTLEPPTAGRVLVDNVDPFTLPECQLAAFRNRTVGFVFQEHHLLPQCSVLENVLLPTLACRPAGEAEDWARELLRRTGLRDRAEHRPAELSGGEKQRVALARALVNRPQLVLADEPTGNLDGATAERIGDLLSELTHYAGVMLIVVTHSPTLARRFDRQVALSGGVLRPVAAVS